MIIPKSIAMAKGREDLELPGMDHILTPGVGILVISLSEPHGLRMGEGWALKETLNIFSSYSLHCIPGLLCPLF